MDKEQREAFDRLDGKLDGLRKDFADHRVESAQNVAIISASAKSAHHRLDECEMRQKEKRGLMASLWVGVILALISSVVHWFTGRKS